MRLKNEIFAYVLDWLIQEGKVEDQKDLAVKTGISQNTVSRIMTGKVEPSDETLRKLNAAFKNIFNMQYLRGESVVMLIKDVAYYQMHPEKNPLNNLNDEDAEKEIDQSSLVNAALAAKDETITVKDETIALLRGQIEILQSTIATKNDMIKLLQRQIEDLRHQLSIIREQETWKDFPFSTRASEPRSEPRK